MDARQEVSEIARQIASQNPTEGGLAEIVRAVAEQLKWRQLGAADIASLLGRLEEVAVEVEEFPQWAEEPCSETDRSKMCSDCQVGFDARQVETVSK